MNNNVLRIFFVSILGLARSPTVSHTMVYPTGSVSILGLARSPTVMLCVAVAPCTVSILGLARSPTFMSSFEKLITFRFNTWAREEPN